MSQPAPHVGFSETQFQQATLFESGLPAILQMRARSALGLVDLCHLLPDRVVEQKTVVAVQHELQMLLKFLSCDWR